MPGRRPIFATLVSGLFTTVRDVLFKLILDPAASRTKRKREQNLFEE
jgi:hypothetical protein